MSKSLLYFALGIVVMTALSAATHNLAPNTQFGTSGVTLDETSITFSDGSTQVTAPQAATGVPGDLFRSGCSVTKETAASVGQCVIQRTVLAHERLVIETVTGTGYADNYILGTAYLSYSAPLGTGTGPLQIKVAFPWVEQLPVVAERRFFGFHESTTLYVDGPATLQFNVFGSSSTGTNDYSLEYSISGFLVPLP